MSEYKRTCFCFNDRSTTWCTSILPSNNLYVPTVSWTCDTCAKLNSRAERFCSHCAKPHPVGVARILEGVKKVMIHYPYLRIQQIGNPKYLKTVGTSQLYLHCGWTSIQLYNFKILFEKKIKFIFNFKINHKILFEIN